MSRSKLVQPYAARGRGRCVWGIPIGGVTPAGAAGAPTDGAGKLAPAPEQAAWHAGVHGRGRAQRAGRRGCHGKPAHLGAPSEGRWGCGARVCWSSPSAPAVEAGGQAGQCVRAAAGATSAFAGTRRDTAAPPAAATGRPHAGWLLPAVLAGARTERGAGPHASTPCYVLAQRSVCPQDCCIMPGQAAGAAPP